MVFIEDRFTNLGPKEVLEYLTLVVFRYLFRISLKATVYLSNSHSSSRIRKHCMDNILFHVCNSGQIQSSFVFFNAADLAPFLLPKLDQLLSARDPSTEIKQFAEVVVTQSEMARALAAKEQCSKLAEFLIRNNEAVNDFAIAALRKMMKMDARVITAVYTALHTVVPQIPPSESPGHAHPSETYVAELTPNIILDCFANAQWSIVSPLIVHKSDAIRGAALGQIITEAAKDARVRHGLFETKTIRLLEHYYESPQPPVDVLDFFSTLLPLLSPLMCRQTDEVHWLISRLNDPTAKIADAVISAFRTNSATEEPAILRAFVAAELLRRLHETALQETATVTALICHLLPLLALQHTRAKGCSRIISFLDHADSNVANACLQACENIIKSKSEDRAYLYAEILKLNSSKESTLRLYDLALPVLCEDWAAAGNFAMILKYFSHPQQRVRHVVHKVWRTIVSTSSSARAKVAHDGHLGVIFELCGSPHEDCVTLGSYSLPYLAVEIAKAGPGTTRQLVRLLDNPQALLRQAVLRSIHIIAESSSANCEVLLAADILDTMKLTLQRYPVERVDISKKIFVCLAPHVSKLHDACCGLLQLLK
jgi:hypothetical protein